ncbi:hypothetical protein OROMI_034037 [Orobanche minor]
MVVSGTIIIMLCRKWDVNDVTGRYLSTDFIVSHGRLLKEGSIYSTKDFTVLPNKDEYRIMKDDACKIEFNGATTVRRASVKADGSVRHLFQMTQQKTGSRTLDFYLTNQRVTLWGGLGDVLIERKTKNVGVYVAILTSVSAKHYNNKLYLLSSSSTLILDDDEIPAVKQFKLEFSHSESKAGTLENLLTWARNKKNDSSTFNYKVRINNVRTRKGWNYPSCCGEKCKKGLDSKEG